MIKIGDGTSTYNELPYFSGNNAMPSFTSSENGKYLCITDGAAVWSSLPYTILEITEDDYNNLETKDSNTLYIIGV